MHLDQCASGFSLESLEELNGLFGGLDGAPRAVEVFKYKFFYFNTFHLLPTSIGLEPEPGSSNTDEEGAVLCEFFPFFVYTI